MDEPPHKHLDHQTPDWIREDRTYFITICTQPKGVNQLCHSEVGVDVLKAIRNYHENRKWFCDVAVLMPGHVHFLLSFPDIPSFSPIIGDWKRWITTRHKVAWQENYFDHRIRNEANDITKADYILHNPVRAGFVKYWQDWPYVWLPDGEH